MNRMQVIGIALSLGTICAACGPASAGNPLSKLPLVDKLPANTYVYVFRAGSDVMSQKLAGTPAGRIVADEEVAFFLKSLEGMLDKHSDGDVRVIWEILKQAFHSDIVCVHVPGEDGDREIACIAIPRNDARREALKSALDDAVKVAAGADQDDVEDLKQPVPNGVIYGNMGWVSDRLVLFSGPTARRIVLGESQGQPLSGAKRFVEATEHLELENPVGFYYYDLEPLWKEVADDEETGPNELPGRLEASGLTSLLAMAGASNVAGGRYHNEHFWVVDERRGGLFKHVRSNPIPTQWLKSIPKNAVSFTYGTWDPGSFLNLLLERPSKRGSRALGEVHLKCTCPDCARKNAKNAKHARNDGSDEDEEDDGDDGDDGDRPTRKDSGGEQPPPARHDEKHDGKKGPETPEAKVRESQMPGGASRTLGKLFGCKVDRDMVRGLGTRYMIYRVPADGLAINPMFMMIPPLMALPPQQMVFALEITDRPAFEKSFVAFWEEAAERLKEDDDDGFIRWSMRVTEYRKKTIYELNSMMGAYFHITDDRLLVSTNPQLVKNAIRRMSKSEPGLVESPEFKAVRSAVPEEACFLVYMHKGSFFELLYRGYKGMAQQFGPMLMAMGGGAKDVDFSFADMPSTDAISQHIESSAYLYAVAKGDGVLFRGQADLLPLSWWVAQIQVAYDVGVVSADY